MNNKKKLSEPELKKKINDLEEELQFQRSITNNAGDSIIVTDSDYKIIYINPAAEKMYGYKLRELKGKTPDVFNAEENSEEIQNEIYDTVKKGRTHFGEALNVRKDGSTFVVQHSISPIKNKDGNLLGYIGSQRDITDLREAETDLRESEELYRTLVETMTEGLCKVDGEGIITLVNTRFCDLLEYKKKELTGRKVIDFIDETDKQKYLDQVKLRRKGEYESYKLNWRKKKGQRVPTLVSPRPVMDAEGKVMGAFALITDISELEKVHLELEDARDRLSAEVREKDEALRESLQRLELVVLTANMGSWDYDIENNKISYSDEWLKILGFKQGKRNPALEDWLNLVHPEDKEVVEKELLKNIKGGSKYYSTEHRLMGGDGKYRWVHARGMVTKRNDNNKPLFHTGVFFDITEKKTYEEELNKHREHLESLIDARTEELKTLNKSLHQEILEREKAEKELELTVNATTESIWKWETTKNKIEYGNHFFRMLGYNPDKFKSSKDIHEQLIHPDDLRLLEEYSGNFLKNREDVFSTNFRVKANNGGYRWISSQGKVVEKDKNGKPLRLIGSHRDITSRKTIEDELRFQSMLLDQIQDLIIATDLEGRINYVNEAVVKIMKRNRSELLGETVHALGEDPVKGATQNEIIEKTLQNGNWTGEVVNLDSRGQLHTIETRTSIVKDSENKPLGMVGISTDITHRKQIEENLRASEEKFRSAFEASPVGMALVGLDGSFISVNSKTEELLGYSAKELLKLKYQDITHPDDITVSDKNYKELIEGKINSYALRKRYLRKDKKTVTAVLSISSIKDSKGKPLMSIAQLQDITKRVEAETALKESEERFRGAFQYASTGMFLASLDGNFTDVNNAASRILGYSRKELLNKNFRDITHPDDLQLSDDKLSRLMSGEFDSYSTEKRYVHKNGSTIHAILSASILRDENNQPKMLISQIQDITEKVKAENALKESEERYRHFIQNFQGIAFRGTLEYIPVFFKGLTEKITGYKEEEFMAGNPPWDGIIHKDDLDEYYRDSKPLFETPGYSTDREYRIIRKDGGIRWVHEYIHNIYDDSGKPLYVQGSLYDITEKKQLEEELLKAEKLESIGILAGGIAHDFNNILSGVLGNISLAQVYDQTGKAVDEVLHDAEAATIRAKELTNQLLTFSRGGAPVIKTESIEGLIRESARFSLHGSNVSFKIKAENDIPNVSIDAGQISQVFNNLFINADQAMPSGGTVSIIIKNLHDSDALPPQLKKGRYVKIKVSDTGSGISKDDMDRIFEPYFTTKEKGSGLGLATSYSIIKQHGGLIQVDSASGGGTTFTVFLPAAEGKRQKAAKDSQEIIRGEGKILIVDDDPNVQDVARRMLESLGYKVTSSVTGEEGLQTFKHHMTEGSSFDLIIMDLTIPGGMGGKDLISVILDIEPDTRAIVVSGYSQDPVLSKYSEYGFKAAISKPFKIQELSQIVHKVISGK